MPTTHDTRSEIGSEKNAAEAPKSIGRIREARKKRIFRVSDRGRDIWICPRAVIISTLTYWNDRGIIMHSKMNMYFADSLSISGSDVKRDAKSPEPKIVKTNITIVYDVMRIWRLFMLFLTRSVKPAP